jgi:hypothetical protein
VPSQSLSEPSCNISGGLSGIWRVVFSPPCHWLSVPSLLGGPPLQAPLDRVDLGGGSLSPSELRRQVLVAQRNLKRLRNQLGSPTYQTGKNLGSNSGLPQEAEGESDQLPTKIP